ncbi:MAG: hypothetical protein MRZ79_19390 [Bacteroidia bacterium]|nr:hypothetical protein [Bacteroidia bacterium]
MRLLPLFMKSIFLMFATLLLIIPTGAQNLAQEADIGDPEVSLGSAQVEETDSTDIVALPKGYLTPKGDSVLRLNPLKKITLTGYYRFFGYGRDMTMPYPNLAPFERAYGVGDGYREPMLSLLAIGRPNGKTSFMTEMFMFTPYAGNIEDNVFTMNLGINFYGNFRTQHGKFGIRAGGIHWYAMSPFTMGIFQAFDLYSIFDRTPWEPVNNTEKYEAYYSSGSINRDTRWNNRAFQGLIVEGGDLPGRMSFAFLFGKSQVNGGLPGAATDPLATIINPGVAGNLPTYQGFAGNIRSTPNSMTGFRLKKDFKQGFLAYNTIYNRSRLDSIQPLFQTYNVHTLEYNFNVAKLNISGEVGAGNFSLPNIENPRWGEVAMLRLKVPKDYTFIPLELQLYQVSKDFYNDNGEIQTFSNPEIQTQILGVNQVGQAAAGGALTQVGQLAHNRRGFNLFAEKAVGPFQLKAGLGIAQELDTITNELSYIHRINGLAMSRLYNPFPAGATGPTIVGPYQRVITFFRGAYETVRLTDLDAGTLEPLTLKNYQALDLALKYKTKVFKKPLYFFYLGSFMGASPNARLFPVFNDETYLHAQYHEFDLYYELFPKFILTGYYGLERIKGGVNTELDIESLQPRNQLGQGIGVGFDWTVAENAAFYLRQRWMNFEDRSFALDKYRGNETTLELKVFF